MNSWVFVFPDWPSTGDSSRLCIAFWKVNPSDGWGEKGKQFRLMLESEGTRISKHMKVLRKHTKTYKKHLMDLDGVYFWI